MIGRLSLVALIGFAFGSGSVVNRFAITELSPLLVGAMRVAVASLIFAGLLLIRRAPLPRGRALRTLALVGVGYVAAPVLVFTTALRFVSSGVQGVLFAMLPLVTAAIAHVALPGERLTRRKLVGLLVGLAGVVALIASRTAGIVGGAFDIRGHLLTLIGVVSVAGSVVASRRRLRDYEPLTVAGVQTFAAALICIPIALLAGSAGGAGAGPGPLAALLSASPLILVALLYLGVFGSVVPFTATFFLVRRYGATDSSLPGYLIPVVAASLGALLLAEQVTGAFVLGGALVLASVLLVSTK